jgi:hypothetical protein
MRKLWMGVALLLVAHAAFAAVQYEFVQTSRSDSDGQPPMDLSAKATLDGLKSRVDFISGNAYPPGTYVVSTDGARRLRFVDPAQKAYTEVNTLSIASALGTSSIKIENLVPVVTKLEDQQIIAGIPTDHYRLTLTFDITVPYRNMPLRQAVRCDIDKWTTVRFGDLSDAFTANALQTGNASIDNLITAELGKIRGFPLKQTVKISVINTTTSKSPRADSQLKVPMTQTLTREMTVMTISEKKVDDAIFDIPAEFKRTDFSELATKTQTQVLSLEPASK